MNKFIEDTLSRKIDAPYLTDVLAASCDDLSNGDESENLLSLFYGRLAIVIQCLYPNHVDIDGYTVINILKDNNEFELYSRHFDICETLADLINGIMPPLEVQG